MVIWQVLGMRMWRTDQKVLTKVDTVIAAVGIIIMAETMQNSILIARLPIEDMALGQVVIAQLLIVREWFEQRLKFFFMNHSKSSKIFEWFTIYIFPISCCINEI